MGRKGVLHNCAVNCLNCAINYHVCSRNPSTHCPFSLGNEAVATTQLQEGDGVVVGRETPKP